MTEKLERDHYLRLLLILLMLTGMPISIALNDVLFFIHDDHSADQIGFETFTRIAVRNHGNSFFILAGNFSLTHGGVARRMINLWRRWLVISMAWRLLALWLVL